jgi:hypothetical protein
LRPGQSRNFTNDTDKGNILGVKFSIVAANNHYSGFGPETVNIFRQLIGLEEANWRDKSVTTEDLGKENYEGMNKPRLKTTQTNLSDFSELNFN